MLRYVFFLYSPLPWTNNFLHFSLMNIFPFFVFLESCRNHRRRPRSVTRNVTLRLFSKFPPHLPWTTNVLIFSLMNVFPIFFYFQNRVEITDVDHEVLREMLRYVFFLYSPLSWTNNFLIFNLMNIFQFSVFLESCRNHRRRPRSVTRNVALRSFSNFPAPAPGPLISYFSV